MGLLVKFIAAEDKKETSYEKSREYPKVCVNLQTDVR